jgi:hypothetical protein
MKRIILSVIVMAFAVAVQAGDAKTCQVKDTDKPACCPSKVKTSVQAKTSQDSDKDQAGCCASKVKTSVEAKGGCPFTMSACSKQAPAKQTVLASPKAADQASY